MIDELVLSDVNKMILETLNRAYQRAFETAVRTGTALVFSRNSPQPARALARRYKSSFR